MSNKVQDTDIKIQHNQHIINIKIFDPNNIKIDWKS